MSQAVIALKGKQYHVSEGDLLVIDQMADTAVEVDGVLLYHQDEKVLVGTPYLSNVRVLLTVEGKTRGPKIEVRRFKAKSRYRRHQGHKQPQVNVRVKTISLSK